MIKVTSSKPQEVVAKLENPLQQVPQHPTPPKTDAVQRYLHTCIDRYLFTDICLHACMHAYIHTYIHTFVRTYVRTYMHTDIHTYMHTYIRTYIHYIHCINTYVQTYTTMYTYIYVYIYIYIHTHMYTYTCAYIHTYLSVCTYITPSTVSRPAPPAEHLEIAGQPLHEVVAAW